LNKLLVLSLKSSILNGNPLLSGISVSGTFYFLDFLY
jgi:hypothetical protein